MTTSSHWDAAAADQAAVAIRMAIQKNDRARMIAATGASQFELLDALTTLAGIDWERLSGEFVDRSSQWAANRRRHAACGV